MGGPTLARLFVIFGGLLVLALVAALIVPYLVNWTGYRADFEREASQILGRTVTVQGDVSARLLPFPSVTFGDVRVAGETSAQPAMTIEEFSMDAELAPFMRGELLIFDMRLVRPNAIFNLAADGSVDWAARRTSNMFDPRQIRLEKMTVTEGKVTLTHASSGRTHTLTEINADVSAATLSGPWRMDGSLRLDGMRAGISVSTGSVTPEGAMRIRVRASPERYPFEVEADGQARFENAAALYTGTFRLDAHNAEAAVPAEAQGRTARIADYRFSGRFALDHRRLDIPEFRLETGPRDNPYMADGTALFHLGADPRFLVQATGAQVRFDDATAAAAAISGASLEQRFAALRSFLEDLPRPTIPGTIDLDLPAIVAGDTTIRDVRLSAEPAATGWTVETLSATLPGRTTLEAKGRLDTEGTFGFKGNLLLAVAQPSGFAAWVARDVDDVIRRLPGAGFSADVELGEERQSFRNVELVLGDTRFEGSLERVAREALRPVLTAKLRGDALDVDGLTAFASLFVSDAGVTRFGDHDIDFDLKAGPVQLAGVSADAIDVAMRLREDNLEVDRLSVSGLGGANIGATASITGIGGAPAGKLDAALLGSDVRPLADFLVRQFPGNPLSEALAGRLALFPSLAQDVRIDIAASVARTNDGADIAWTAQGLAGGNAFSLAAGAYDYDGDLSKAKLSLDLDVEAPDSAQLLALYGLPAVDLGLAPEGTTSLSLSGIAADGAALTVSVTAPGTLARFDGTLRRVGDGDEPAYVAEGSARLSAGDLEPWLLSTGTMLPGMGIGLPVELTAKTSYGMASLRLADLKGTIIGTAVSGDLAATWPDGTPHLEGALKLAGFDLVSAAAMVLGEDSVQGEGEGWSSVPFAETLRLPFTAQLDMALDTLDAGFQPLADDVTVSAKLDREGLRISNLTGHMLGGTVKGLVELANNGGTGLLSGQISVSDAQAAALLGSDDVAGQADFSATVTATGKSIEGLLASLAGSGTARFRDLVIPGLDPGALGAILVRADEIGRDIDDAQVSAFAAGMVSTGRFPAGTVEVPFTVATGSVRTPAFFMRTDGAALSMEMQANLGTNEITGSGTIDFDAGTEALVGSEPSLGIALTGRFGETAARFDTAPMTQYLTQRALEREQARVEAMQAGLLERQRLRREVRYYAALADDAARLREEAAEQAAREAERRRIEQEERLRQEAAANVPADPVAVDREPPEPPVPTRAQRPATGDVEFSLDAIGKILQDLPDRP